MRSFALFFAALSLTAVACTDGGKGAADSATTPNPDGDADTDTDTDADTDTAHTGTTGGTGG